MITLFSALILAGTMGYAIRVAEEYYKRTGEHAKIIYFWLPIGFLILAIDIIRIFSKLSK